MEQVFYNSSEIVSLKRNGFKCVCKDGSKHFIDLELCRRNWADRHHIEDSAMHCVADRNSTARAMYILFYSEPQVMVAFTRKRGKLNRLFNWLQFGQRDEIHLYRDFKAFSRKLQHAGWNLCDIC